MVLSAVTSDANTVIYQFEPISTGLFPGGQTPQVQAIFQDENPGSVLLNITSSDLGRRESLSDLYFNFDPADKVKKLHFTLLDGPCGRTCSTVSTGMNSFKADGGYYDIHFDFNRTKDSMTYQIVGAGLDASDFAFLDSTGSCGGKYGTYYALAHIQGICGNSEWLGCRSLQPVPEPAPLVFHSLAASLGCYIHTRVKRTRRTRSPC